MILDRIVSAAGSVADLFGGAGLEVQPARLRRIEAKLDRLLEHHGLEREAEPPVPDDLRALWRAGKKVEAIRRYRRRHGAGLKQAKERLEGRLGPPDPARIEAKLDLLLAEADLRFDPFEGVEEEVVAALRRGRKIEAIKILRETSGLGLREAKERVEELQRGL